MLRRKSKEGQTHDQVGTARINRKGDRLANLQKMEGAVHVQFPVSHFSKREGASVTTRGSMWKERPVRAPLTTNHRKRLVEIRSDSLIHFNLFH